MNRLFLMRNPPLFQGESYLNLHKNYFEGWYFKNSNQQEAISFIPGISIEETKKAFIQVITDETSYFINYSIQDFHFGVNPFFIQIGNNLFSENGIHIDITQKQLKLSIHGEIQYTNHKPIHTHFLSPNIMGPFSYVPFMECNHAILSMKQEATGFVEINHHSIAFQNDCGYIEKDWGTSFPQSYIWCQGNQFQNTSASFMLSIADIPFQFFHFKGIICVLMLEDKEYRFTTYNGTRLVKAKIEKDLFSITLQKGSYCLKVESKYDSGHKLSAPVKGKMEKNIMESISSSITVTLKKGNRLLFADTSHHCGLEIVQK